MIRFVRKEDAQQICDIYNYYVKNTTVTFEEELVSTIDMEERIDKITASLPWFVYENNGEIIGYTYAGKWHNRSAYRFTTEATVYLKHDFLGKGIGTELYTNLIKDLKEKGIHSVMGVVALPNEKSQRLHEKCGFKKVGEYAEVGYKFNKWQNVGYWQRIL